MHNLNQHWYRPDLAFIHDVGFSGYALNSAPGILEMFEQAGLQGGFVVELGCGSGVLTQALVAADYSLLGIDISEAMIAIAQQKVPTARFQVASLFQVAIPSCHAVVAVGECLSYLFDSNHQPQALHDLFQRIYQALIPGGLFVFDIVEPEQGATGQTVKNFTEGEGWLVLVEKTEDLTQSILTRRIITLRQQGDSYRRDDEVHQQRLYHAAELAKILQQVGFQVQSSTYYGQFQLPPAHSALVAHKPTLTEP